MNFRVTIGLAALWFTLHLSCDTVSDPCGPFPSHFDVNGYSVILTQPSFGAPAVDSALVHRYDSIAIRPIPLMTFLYTESSGLDRFGIQRAHACTPPIPFSIDTLVQLWVTADADYDSSFMAGDTLNPILTVSFIDERNGPQEMPLTDFLATEPSVRRDMYLRFTAAPAQARMYRFTIDTHHAGGEEFRYTTASVTIKP